MKAFLAAAMGLAAHSFVGFSSAQAAAKHEDQHAVAQTSEIISSSPNEPHNHMPGAPAIAPPPPPFHPTEFRPFKLINVYDETPNTKVYRFAYPNGMQRYNGALTSCIVFKYTDKDGKEVLRPYTPISRSDQPGFFEVMVKQYKDSKMGNHLAKLKVGQAVEVKGPYDKFLYKPGAYKRIGMIAGGTGITPMFQLCREALRDAKGQPEMMNLIYCNHRKEDVLLGSELSELMEVHQNFAPYFVLSDPPRDWMGGVGHINKEMIRHFMPPPQKAHDSVILVCGPPGFMQAVCGDKDFTVSPPSQGQLGGMLKDLGYPQKMVYKF